ncbi:hypothetical protein GCK32_018925, partial [Trichostrongylus colubriformis]
PTARLPKSDVARRRSNRTFPVWDGLRIDRVAMLVSESSPKMPASYSSTPISGFTGHIPGAKWQVGSRYRPPTRGLQSSYAPSSFSEQSVHDSSSRGARENHGHEPGNDVTEDDRRRGGGQQNGHYEGGHRSVQFSPERSRHVYLERNPGGSDPEGNVFCEELYVEPR